MDQTSETLALPDAPALAGLAFRHFRDQRDYDAMADIQNAVSLADQLDYTVTAADLANWYGPTSQSDPYQDIIIAQVDGAAVAFGAVAAYQETSSTRVYFPQGRVSPLGRRQGIGRAILHHNERRLRAIAASHPLDGPRTFLTYAADTAVGTVVLLTQEGYQPVRHYYHMLRDSLEGLPDAPLPDGLEVRPVLPEHYRLIWEAEQEAFQYHWGYVRATEDDYRIWLADRRFDPTLWRIAWDGDQVAGQVLSFIDAAENEAHQRRRGYTENISVRRPWRQRGVARALIAQSLAALQAQGMTEAALRVDTDNQSGALRLYESCGFRVHQSSAEYRKPLDETAG
jgi:ribosomal protein S18 acetylase RimI-like enzyme